MKMCSLPVFLASAFIAPLAAVNVTPVQQVVNMLNDMKVKGEKMLLDEQKLFAEYTEWVDDKTKELNFEIETSENTIAKLTAFIELTETKISELVTSIQKDDADIATLESEKEAGIKVRETEKAEADRTIQDHAESVDALERAIQVLSSEAYSRPQAEALLQRLAKQKPAMQAALAAFLQEQGQQDGAPAVAAYEFQSGGIVAVLEKLLAKFKAQLEEAQSDESNSAHAFNLQDEHLANSIKQLNAERERKAEAKAKNEAASAKAQGELAQTKSDLADDTEFLSHVKATFDNKGSTYNMNQDVRKQELEALGKAIDIISNPTVADSYSEHVNAQLAQVSSRRLTLLQTRSSKGRVTARQRAAEFLQKRARSLNSDALASLATAMGSVSENPFAKVITMIEDLLAKLKAQAAAEAEHKAWCDEQLNENKHKRDAKTIAVDTLTAEIAKTAGEIATMGETIDILIKEQAELTKAMSEATAVRTKEKAENEDTIADAKAGAAAVANALSILQEFYSSQASFLQKSGRQVPEMAEYKGMSGSGGGAMGMLEVIQTDFMRLDAETTAAETQAAKEYDAFMDESTAAKVRKHEEEVKLKLEKDQAEFEKSELEKDLASEQAELNAANKYFDELKPQCLQVHVSYEERVQRREEELAALNEAYEILDQKSSD